MLKSEDILFDFELYAENLLKIKTEVGEIIPFRFNSAQKKVNQKIKDKYKVKRITIDLVLREDFALRMIFLKARQQGISTWAQAFVFWIEYLLDNYKCLTMGHKTDASNNLFDMYKRYYDNLPKWAQRSLSKSNEKKVQYAKSQSENKIDTAGAGEIGRSDTLQLLHLTEVAFYPDQKTTFVGLLQGAKYAKVHFIESTANGYDLFRDRCMSAMKGESIYDFIFLSWLDFPEYIIESKKRGFIKDLQGDDLERFKRDIGNPLYNEYEGEEKLLIDKYGATIDQLQFRRYAIDELCEKDINKFHQEYPRDPDEAFVSSGRPVFLASKVQQNLSNSRKPLKQGDLVYRYDDKQNITGVEFIENPRGFIKIWTEPEPVEGQYRWAGGWDVAEGLEQGDYSTGAYLDRHSFEVHLTWHGHLDPDLLGEEQHKIHLFLNSDTYCATEKNNHGLTTLVKSVSLGVPQYSKESFNRGYMLRSAADFGHTTSQKTKKHLVDTENEWIRDDLFKDYDEDYWKECLTFVRNARGQTQAEGKDKDPSIKNFDDRVISRGLMIVCSMWMPTFSPKKKNQRPSRGYILETKKPKGITKF